MAGRALLEALVVYASNNSCPTPDIPPTFPTIASQPFHLTKHT